MHTFPVSAIESRGPVSLKECSWILGVVYLKALIAWVTWKVLLKLSPFSGPCMNFQHLLNFILALESIMQEQVSSSD
jgi:hypothetical protein